ncbi:hypothetical protein H4R19_002241 [Coemansia spiralis]|nr:hypothetical protein H4R19_002241 [Coemansia spiralis]
MDSYLAEQWPADGLAFDPWAYSRAAQQGILLAVFKDLNVLAVLELSASSMLDFFLDIEALYNDLPYHSFNHAVDVVVKLYYVLHDLHAAAYLASYDIAALLISALCHDCGHPGMNNLFQKNANTELGQKYPDAILERYSVDLTVECIQRHGLFRNVESLRDPIYSDSTATQVDVASRMLFSVRAAIMATDMTRHFGLVEDCRALVAALLKKARVLGERSPSPRPANPPETAPSRPPRPYVRVRAPSEPASPMKQLLSYSIQEASRSTAAAAAEAATETATPAGTGAQGGIRRLHLRRSASMSDGLLDSTQRQTLINILLHTVDVFNPVLPWPMCKKWSDLMNAESFHQGDREKELGLPVSPNMDRVSTDQRQVSLDFGNIIIRPFFSEVVSLFPVDDALLPSLESNLQRWSRLSTDATHEICPPAGANSHMYSWPVEPMDAQLSLSTSSSYSEGRRLSIAPGTVDIPPSRLEAIRRHSHEGLEALHRCMVGHMFSRRLVQIQERRKVSYLHGNNQQQKQQQKQQQQQPQAPDRRPRLQSLGSGPTVRGPMRGVGASMLSPVSETASTDALPTATFPPNLAEPSNNGDVAISVHGLPPMDRGPASASWEASGPAHGFTGHLYGSTAAVAQQEAPMPSTHLRSYCVDSPVCSPRLNRSVSLDPTLLFRLPTAYPSLAGDNSPAASPSEHPRDG